MVKTIIYIVIGAILSIAVYIACMYGVSYLVAMALEALLTIGLSEAMLYWAALGTKIVIWVAGHVAASTIANAVYKIYCKLTNLNKKIEEAAEQTSENFAGAAA